MLSTTLSLIPAILLFGFLIFIHELGHFLAARRVGVKVFEFAIGMGPVVYTYEGKEDIKYCLRAFPFGGFVSMKGEEFEEDDEGRPFIDTSDPESLASKTVFERFQVFFAGPIMNLLTAIVVIIGLSLFGISESAYLDEPVTIDYVTPDSVAAQQGISPGMTIVSLNDTQTPDWRTFNETLATVDGETLIVTTENPAQTFTIQVNEKFAPQQLANSVFYALPALIDEIVPGFPADRAGMEEGDIVTAINGQPIAGWYELVHIVSNSPGTPVNFTVQRKNGETASFTITPQDTGDNVGRIGAQVEMPTTLKRYGFFESVSRGLTYAVQTTGLMYWIVGQLITGGISPGNLGGPVEIMRQAGNTAQEDGLSDLLQLMAFLSMNLFVLNLLPIPVLDGGHIMFLIPETVTGEVVSARIRLIAIQIGAVFLLSLMFLITVKDIWNLF